MLTLFMLIATSGDQLKPVQVHRAELNQIYHIGESGEVEFILRQWIFWSWDPYGQRWVVREWQLAKPGMPRPMRIRGRWLIPFCGKECGPCFVLPGTYHRTWTMYDPEMKNRDSFLPSMRTPLNRRGQ